MPLADECASSCLVCLIVPAAYLAWISLPALIQILFGSSRLPHVRFNVCVENGTLHMMDMNYSNDSTHLTYSLSTVFSFRNTWYDGDIVRAAKLDTVLLYGGQQLGPASPSTFQVRYLETTMVPIDVRGKQAAGAVVARTYADDATRGYYTIQVKFSMRFELLQWCDSSCTLYFFAPLSGPRGAPNIFDGDDCWTKCDTSVFHDTEQSYVEEE